ncbi:hypothetical protein BGZ76_006538 [Entomortierella beljakovae]|nr:hypothetical protein BGZ76_006538 [Entomortierella beljakovae]
MRLRAKLNRDHLFFKNAQAVEKIGKSCFIKFTPDYVAFGAIHSPGDNNKSSGGGAIQCWSRLSKDHIGNSRVITQNVPIVKILTVDGDSNSTIFEEPMIPAPDVHIMLPDLERLRHVLASYKNLAEYVVISANLNGEMVLTTSDGIVNQFENMAVDNGGTNQIVSARYATAEKAHVETRFTNLYNPPLADGDDDEEDHERAERIRSRPEEFVSAMVKVLDFQKVLQSQYIKPANVICTMIPNHSMLFYVYLKEVANEATLTYLIPEIV